MPTVRTPEDDDEHRRRRRPDAPHHRGNLRLPARGVPVTAPADADADDLDDENGGECHFCGGEGYEECDDPIQCTKRHTADGLCPCASCGGSGLAKDMTIW
jgi:hypothetical protein